MSKLNSKNKLALMVAFLVLLLGLSDVAAVQTSYGAMFMLAMLQVIGGLAVAAYVLIKKYL